ncbi:MAG: ABC transporter ATP-binding protein [Alphaproteobacteria bacterium]|nr:ABC transporter ATP-binding protein [Alphaproteobacteria bacterium]
MTEAAPRSPQAEPSARADAPASALLRRIFREYGKPYLHIYLLATLLLALGAIATAASAYLLKPVVNGMIDGDRFRHLRTLAWAVVGLFCLRGFATFASMMLLSRTGNKIVAAVQTRLYDHILKQDMRFFQAHHSTDFMSRLAVAANGVRDVLQALVMSVSRDVLTLIALIIVMIVHNPLLAAIALIALPLGGLILSQTVGKLRRYARRSYDGTAQIMQIMQETILGSRIVKSFALEDEMRRRMNLGVRNVEKASNKISTSVAISSPVADILAGFAIGLVIFVGSYRIAVERADAGSFFSFVAALLLAYEPAKRLARLKLELQKGLTGARMIFEILDRPAAEAQDTSAPALTLDKGSIEFRDLAFRYRDEESVLDGFSMIAEPNRTTALVGPSGGGKSTVIALLQKFYTPDAGTIRIDGQDIQQVSISSLRKQIAFVSQDVFLFRGSIRENIAMGREGASEDEIIAAAIKAHAHEFITGFASGYDTPVGEHGAQLSGGQKQRIAIARAVLKNAPILLLDEPTAALDSESERMVQEALDELKQGRTTIVVAHRLQTIVNADRICVVEGGTVAQSGTHAELMAVDGAYKTYFASQFGETVEPLRPAGAARL